MICKICKKQIDKGTMCDACKLNTARELKSSFENSSTPSLKDLKSNPKIYKATYKVRHKPGKKG